MLVTGFLVDLYDSSRPAQSNSAADANHCINGVAPFVQCSSDMGKMWLKLRFYRQKSSLIGNGAGKNINHGRPRVA